MQAVAITVHGTTVGRTCLTVTSKKGDVITVPVHVFEPIAPRFQITTAFASSRVANRTFSSIPSPMPAGLTFRDLLNENSNQRNGAAIMAHARLTETPAVNVYADAGCVHRNIRRVHHRRERGLLPRTPCSSRSARTSPRRPS